VQVEETADLARVGGGQDAPVDARDQGVVGDRLAPVAVDDGRDAVAPGGVQQVLPDDVAGRRPLGHGPDLPPLDLAEAGLRLRDGHGGDGDEHDQHDAELEDEQLAGEGDPPDHAPPPAARAPGMRAAVTAV
jgi:hypothetical protein